MFRREEGHWWYRGQWAIASTLLEHHLPRRRPLDVLDAGCGTGGTTRLLARWGRVTGLDYTSLALDLAGRRGLRLVQGSVASLPFADGSFDLVTSFDVLYHLGVRDDVRALREFHRVLRPGGILLVRVPALEWLRGAHDAAVHTRHRYTRGELAGKLRQAGFRVRAASYANALLLPLAAAKRFLEQGGASAGSDLWQPPGPINRLLAFLFGLEAPLVAGIGLPAGLSVLAVGERATV